MFCLSPIAMTLLWLIPRFAYAHISIWHPSMWGFNVTDKTYPFDNRPVAPLTDMTFDQWWFHGHLDHPPNQGDFFELPAGQAATAELACNKGATSFFASSEGGDIRNGNDPCPGSPMSEWHTTGINDLFGCAMAISYKSDVTQVQPQDFAVFSVNQTCVWTRFTDFQVPARMPPCPEGGCICAWFWIHSPDSGGEQNYMNGFRCNVTGSTSNAALAQPQIPRRCGADPANGKVEASSGNCTYGAKQPFYWFQKERNNMFEGTYAPPRYLDMYNFKDGAQDDIFQDSYPRGLPPPSPNSTVVPTPFLGGAAAAVPTATNSPSSTSASSTASASPSSVSLNLSAFGSSSTAGPSSPSSPALLSSPSPSVSVPVSVSISVSVSTATVVSTAVVTVTQIPTSSFVSSSLPSSPTSTVTVINTVVMTVVETTESSAVASSIGGPPITSTSTVFVVASVPTTEPTTESSSPVVNSGAFAQLDRIVQDDVTPLSSAATTLPTASSNTQHMCKRQSVPSSTLQRRTMSYFSIPGVGRHRKMQRRSDIFNIFF